MKIYQYDDFLKELRASGFSMGGGRSEGIYSLITWNWKEEPPYETPVRWHTGDPETDPWEWRMRVLNEETDIAYGKVFFRKSGYITKEWYPYFLAVRRGASQMEEQYQRGEISQEARKIYQLVREYGPLPLHALKKLGGFDQASKSAFDRGLTELQMHLFLTICGKQQKLSRLGEEYGWSSTVFCTTEQFWGEAVFDQAAKMTQDEAKQRIMDQIVRLNPSVNTAKAKRFIMG